MSTTQIQQDISIIKEMIEKTRKETAESGQFFIAIGLFSIIAAVAIGMLEYFRLNHLIIPLMILMVVVNGLIGYLTVTRKEKKEKVKTYHKTLLYNILFSCAVPAIMILFIFPLLKVYSWNLVPILISLIMGIIIYASGVILESRYLRWCSAAWWAASLLMVYVRNMPRILIMIAAIFLGWVLPGWLLRKQVQNRSKENEA